MQRESFIFYKSYYKVFSLPLEKRDKLLRAIVERALFGIEPELEDDLQIMYDLILPQIEANEKRYLNGCKGAEFGKLGGRPKKENKTPKKPLKNPTKTPNDNVNDNVNVNDNDNIILSTSDNADSQKININFQNIVDIYNSICISLPKVIKLTEARKKAIKSAVELIGSEKDFKNFFKKVEASDFLCGRTENAWTGCGFDWIFKKSNLIKILEGNYDNQNKSKNSKPDYYDASRYENLNLD